MKIQLSDLKEGDVISVEAEYDPKTLDIEFVDLEYTAPLCLEGTVEKGHDTVTFRGRMASDAERICGRCLKRVKVHFDKPFELFYETANRVEIDTMDDLREVMIFEHPITFVCTESCKGLCPQCGINLNESSCRCKREAEEKSSAFSALKKFQQRRKEDKNHA